MRLSELGELACSPNWNVAGLPAESITMQLSSTAA